MSHFLANEWGRSRAPKRGGGQRVVSLDAPTAEERLSLEPVDQLTPETVFERQWAAAVLARCLERLLREEVAETLADPSEADAEIRWLLTTVRRDG